MASASLSSLRKWQWLTLLVAATLLAAAIIWRVIIAPGAINLASHTIPIASLVGISQGNSVELSGVVTFSDERARSCYVQDGTGALTLPVPADSDLPLPGERIIVRGDIAGHAAVGAALRDVILNHVSIKRRDRPGLPRPERILPDDLFNASNTYENHLIETDAVVRAARREGSSLRLELSAAQAVPVYVVDAGLLDPNSLIDASIELSGVLSVRFEAGENAHRPSLLVASSEQIRIVDPPLKAARVVPSLRALVLDPQWVNRGRRIKVDASVAEIESDHVLIAERDGMVMAIETVDASRFSPGELVEVSGWPVRRLGTTRLYRAVVEPIRSLAPSAPPIDGLPLLTSIRAIHALGNAQADRGYPVDLIATVSFIEPGREGFFVIVGNEGIYVDYGGRPSSRFRARQQVHIVGITRSGDFAPVIAQTEITGLGDTQWPKFATVDHEIAPTGAYDCAWVEIEGRIRQVHPESGALLTFDLMTSLAPLRARSLESRTTKLCCNWLMQRFASAACLRPCSPKRKY